MSIISSLSDSIYFPSSGTSTTVSGVSGLLVDRKWYRTCEDWIRFPRRTARGRNCGTGPRPLMDISLRVLADSISDVDGEALQDLPPTAREWLWKELTARNIPFHAWNSLSRCMKEDALQEAVERLCDAKRRDDEITIPMEAQRYCLEIVDPPCELSVYTEPLSRCTDCLTYLTIDNIEHFDSRQLLSLANLRGLAVLELIEREDAASGAIHDRVIKGWSEMKPEPFASLRVLKIVTTTEDISQQSLEYAMHFPRLEIFDIAGPNAFSWFKVAEHIRGWKKVAFKLREPHLLTYMRAFLPGSVLRKVDLAGLGYHEALTLRDLKLVFENSKTPIQIVYHPRTSSSPQSLEQGEQEEETGEKNAAQHPIENPSGDSRSWKLAAEEYKRWFKPANSPLPPASTPEGTDNDIFWFLAFLDQNSRKADDEAGRVQAEAAGIPLPRERFVSLRLRHRGPSFLSPRRSVFARDWSVQGSKGRDGDNKEPQVSSSRTTGKTSRGRSTSDLRPRKRKAVNVGDLLATLEGS